MVQAAALEIQIGANVKAAIAGLDKVSDEVKQFAAGTNLSIKNAADAFTILKKAQENATNTADLQRYNQALQEIRQTQTQLQNVGIAPAVKEVAPAMNTAESATKKMQNTTFAFNQVMREAPAFAYSFQTGLMGISNNLPMLADNLRAASAAGVTKAQMFRQLGMAMISPLNLIGVGIALLPTITALFNKKSESTKKAANAQNEYANAVKAANKEVSGQIQSISQLVGFLNRTDIAPKEREAAVKQLVSTNNEYFKQLLTEKSTIDDVNKAYEIYIANVFRLAKAKVNAAEIDKLTTKLLPVTERLTAINEQLQTPSKKRAFFGLAQIKKDAEEVKQILNNSTSIGLTADAMKRLIEITGLSESAARNLVNDRLSLLTEEVKLRSRILDLSTKLGTPNFSATSITDKAKEKKVKVKVLPEVDTDIQTELTAEDLKKFIRDRVLQGREVFPIPVRPQMDEVNAKGDIIEKLRRIQTAVSSFNFNPIASTEELTKLYDGVLEKGMAIADFVGSTLTQPFQTFFTTLIDGSGNAFEAFGKALGNIIKRLVATAAAALLVTAILSTIPGFNAMAAGKGITTFAGKFKGISGMMGLSLPFANGGIVDRPTNALIGESGPEAVIPLDRFNALASGMGGGGNNFNLIPIFRGADLFLQVEKSKKIAARTI